MVDDMNIYKYGSAGCLHMVNDTKSYVGNLLRLATIIHDSRVKACYVVGDMVMMTM